MIDLYLDCFLTCRLVIPHSNETPEWAKQCISSRARWLEGPDEQRLVNRVGKVHEGVRIDLRIRSV